MTNSLSPQLLTPTDRQNRVEQLRNLVVDQVLASSADGILFSGGLDTSVLAAIAASLGRRLQAVMVSVADRTRRTVCPAHGGAAEDRSGNIAAKPL